MTWCQKSNIPAEDTSSRGNSMLLSPLTLAILLNGRSGSSASQDFELRRSWTKRRVRFKLIPYSILWGKKQRLFSLGGGTSGTWMFSRSSRRSFISIVTRVSMSDLVRSLVISFPSSAFKPSVQMQYLWWGSAWRKGQKQNMIRALEMKQCEGTVKFLCSQPNIYLRQM